MDFYVFQISVAQMPSTISTPTFQIYTKLHQRYELSIMSLASCLILFFFFCFFFLSNHTSCYRMETHALSLKFCTQKAAHKIPIKGIIGV